MVGSSFGFVFPAVRALAANLDTERRGERMGRVVSVELIGFVCGPLLGGILIDPSGLSATFLVFGAVALVTVVIVAPRTFPTLVQTGESQKLSIELLRHPRVVVAVLVVMAIQLPMGVYDALWDRYLTDLGGSNIMVGLSFALYSVPFMLLSSAGGKLADRGQPQRIALWSMLVVSPFVFFYGFFDILWIVVGLNIFEGIAKPSPIRQRLQRAMQHRRSSLGGPRPERICRTRRGNGHGLPMPSVYGRFGQPPLERYLCSWSLTGAAAILHIRLERADRAEQETRTN